MFWAIILYGVALLIIAGGLLLGLIYAWEAKIKINNNQNYKNDLDLQSARAKLNLASYICLFALILLIIAVVVFFIFIEIFGLFAKWIILGGAIILFLVLIYVEYLLFSAIGLMKGSTSFTDMGDDATALRDARTGAWSIFVCMFAIIIFIVFLLLLKLKKKIPGKEEYDDYDDYDD